jgi:hypothetical protein
MIECQILAAISHQDIRIVANNMKRSLKMIVRRYASNTIVIGPLVFLSHGVVGLALHSAK